MTGVTGGIPASWVSGLPALSTLVLDNIATLSSIPTDYLPLVTAPQRYTPATVNFTGLLNLQLSGLGMAGPVPAQFFQSPKLQALNLARNMLTGTLGPDWASGNESMALRALDLSGNTLTGTLPAAWSNFTLATLDLSRNNLTGGLDLQLAANGFKFRKGCKKDGCAGVSCCHICLATA